MYRIGRRERPAKAEDSTEGVQKQEKEQVGAGMDQRKRGRKGPSREEKGASRNGRQEEKEKLLRV